MISKYHVSKGARAAIICVLIIEAFSANFIHAVAAGREVSSANAAGKTGPVSQGLSTSPVRFAVIGDYGNAGQEEADVAALVKSWNPDFVTTVGDNNYPDGSSSTIDRNIGQYYHQFIYPYKGAYGAGAASNRFFPILGNHDLSTNNGAAYLNYFTLPGNERYYDFVKGPVHFFMLNSDSQEPDGTSSSSVQAMWLKNKLAASTSRWNLVFLHEAPYSSGISHGPILRLQWPFAAWGADAVLAGHQHSYERIDQNGIPYFVNGAGGAALYLFGAPIPGSMLRYNGDYGAMLVDASESQVKFQFITRAGLTIDTFTLRSDAESAGVFRPGTGALYLRNSNTTGSANIQLSYGLSGDDPVAGDWDGDGTDTIGVYRGNTFLLRNSNTAGFANLSFPFGKAGDQPVAGDWDGDGDDTIGVYRPTTGQFLLRNSNSAGPADISFYLGNVGDVGIAGDWNGDGVDTTGVFRPSDGVIFLKNKNVSGFADLALNYGMAGDQPVVGDWDNNGTTTIGIYRGGRFYLRNSNTNGYADITLDLGLPGDMPIAGNWDGQP